ncbi:MAG: T9SS type A sorting domain-containing protein [Bacteroidota bacterium]
MKHFIIVIFISLALFLNAQRANNWLFGFGAGLNFNIVPPMVVSSGSLSNYDNTSSMSDQNGQLLFYTDGQSVWNRNHVLMPNGSGLLGNTTAGQCALIVPIPSNSNQYVIFHVTEFANPGYLSYSVVDMNLNGGLGDVLAAQKNVSLGSGWTEKMCAYYNPVNNTYWVLTHKWNSNQFVAFVVSATTIASSSVVSNVGTVLQCGSPGSVHDAMGQLTISPDGSKVANALTCTGVFEMLSFNLQSGVLSNPITLSAPNLNAPWGTAFSSNGSRLYVNSIFGDYLCQFDLSNFNQNAIQNSMYTLNGSSTAGYIFGYMELGPDNKIYIARPNNSSLAAIVNANNIGAACNFSYSALSLGFINSSWGLSRIAYNIPGKNNSVGITKNVSIGIEYSIGPNPCDDKLRINGLGQNAQKINYYIYNAFGALVGSGEAFSEMGLIYLNTQVLKSGLYELQCDQGNEVIYRTKLIKQ